MNRHPSEYLGDGGSADGTLVLRTVEEPMRRRRFLGGSMASLGIAGALGATAPHAPADRRPEYPPRGLGQTLGFDLTWLGVNGWWIVFDGVTVLVDPWVTRYATGTFGPDGQDPDTPISWNRTLIDATFSRPADMILLTHGHFDHISDVPLIAARTGATVWGTESHLNLVRSLAARTDTPVDENTLSLLHGGEVRDFGGYSIAVLRSVHRPFGKNQIAATAQSCLQVDPSISAIKDLGEGGSLSYVIANGAGRTLMVLGSGDFSASDLPAECPDAVIFPTGGANIAPAVRRFAKRIGEPHVVIASHWDNFDLPVRPAVDVGNVPALRAAVADVMPHARFVVPEPDTPLTV